MKRSPFMVSRSLHFAALPGGEPPEELVLVDDRHADPLSLLPLAAGGVAGHQAGGLLRDAASDLGAQCLQPGLALVAGHVLKGAGEYPALPGQGLGPLAMVLPASSGRRPADPRWSRGCAAAGRRCARGRRRWAPRHPRTPGRPLGGHQGVKGAEVPRQVIGQWPRRPRECPAHR